MLLGALGAILYKQQNPLFLKITDNFVAQALSWTVIFLIIINKFHVISIIDGYIVSLVAVTLIIGQIKVEKRIINLNTRIFDFLGKISYGIYVIHPLVIFAFSGLLEQFEIPVIYKYPLIFSGIISTTILLSYLSYNYFEKYFLTLKKNFVVIASTNSRNERVDLTV